MTRAEWEALPWHREIRILDHGEDWVAVEKTAGLLSHPNEPRDRRRSLLAAEWIPGEEAYAVAGLPGGRLGLCHRLDGPTSGVLVLAAGEAAAWFRGEFEAGRMTKVYRAVAVGRPRQRSFAWRDRLVKERGEGTVRVRVGKGEGAFAEIRGREIAFRREGLPLTLLRLEPGTGRTHQIRAQAARHGLPVLGDRNYGDFRANRSFRQRGGSDRLFLHAERLSWRRAGESRSVASPPPPEFAGLFPGTGASGKRAGR